ncbi:MAG: 23S rRNA (adenine(2503)-C(2))-methyltransferase RlmN [Paludibacteraceae bacterium]|nr:23S rRNA (adenine(2503)-C(2))-methyltransferase RlmN [Paludibacteraceae bacterium]
MSCLLGKNIEELQQIALSVGLPKYAGKQLAEWLYVKRATSFDEMTNISIKGREALKAAYTVGRHAQVKEAISKDGTRKYLFAIDSQFVEAVYIPEDGRATLCVSTQAGCQMGCKFCMTGTLGFHGQLSAADILNQILTFDDLTNIVYMGEGEPMNNIDNVLRSLDVMTAAWGCGWSPKRITVSSVGVTTGLKRFLDESECHLAISLHNPFAAERQQIMPSEKVYPIKDVLNLIKQYDWTHQRRVSFEYICFGGQNDSKRHADELLHLLNGLECRINLIRFHKSEGSVLPASNERQMEWLRDYLTEKNLPTTIRKSRGEDILAACGMLVNALQQS